MPGQFSALPVPHCTLLWCIRARVLELRRGIDASGQIDDMLTRMGVAKAASALRDMVGELSQSCTRMIEVRCTCHTGLSDDEHTLMAVFSMTQAFEFAAARRLLGRFVNPRGAEAALDHLEVITTALLKPGNSLSSIGELAFGDSLPDKAHFELCQSAAVH